MTTETLGTCIRCEFDGELLNADGWCEDCVLDAWRMAAIRAATRARTPEQDREMEARINGRLERVLIGRHAQREED